VIDRCEESPIGAGRVLMLRLQGCRRRMRLLGPSPFLGGWLSSDAAVAAIEADIAHCGVVDDRLVVDVGDDGRVHLGDGAVLEEGPMVPMAAPVAYTPVTTAVVHAAIEADVGTPVPGMPNIDAVTPTPVAGRP